ncbi:MAG: hypothetical protein GY842_24445 [bacterium]|nr:hypothetical protein [bacterium]
MPDPPYTGSKVEARAAGSFAAVVSPEVRPQVEDPFRYGSRWVEVETATGRTIREVPLTLDDLFDPQEGGVKSFTVGLLGPWPCYDPVDHGPARGSRRL